MAVTKKKSPSKSAHKPAAKRPAAKPKAVVKKAAPAKKIVIKKVAVKKAPAKKVAVKKVPAKKIAAKKAPAKKAAPAKKVTPAKKAVPAKKAAPAKKAVVVKKTAKQTPKRAGKKAVAMRGKAGNLHDQNIILSYGQPVVKDLQLSPWMKKQYDRLLALKDTLLDSLTGSARENLRNAGDVDKASAHGMHQADAGSDAYDRDFALSQLSQEQNALHEIEEALKRIELGTYGVCEMSGKSIPKARLEARPFARYTVECQSEVERKNRFNRYRQPVARLFDNLDDEHGDDSDEESSSDSKD